MSSTLESERNRGIDLTFEEMVDRLGDQRRDILSVLKRSDESRLNTSDLRMGADVPSGSMTHHMETLQRWGLVEEVDRVHVGRGSRAIVWSLTDTGEEFIEDGGLDAGRRVARADDIEELREVQAAHSQRIDEVEADIKTIRSQVMQIAVHTGTFDKDKARDIMGEEWFQDVFEDED